MVIATDAESSVPTALDWETLFSFMTKAWMTPSCPGLACI